jgi:Trk K+ transport system NAD-binding subunit
MVGKGVRIPAGRWRTPPALRNLSRMRRLPRSYRRLFLLIGSLPVVMVALAGIYWAGMRHLEHQSRTFGESLQWAVATMTTTGYGRDTVWTHPAMEGFVIFAEFAGVMLIFLVFPVFIIPFFEERFDTRLMTTLPELDGHVVVFRYGPAVTSLMEALDEAKVPLVIFEEDESSARRLQERGRTVVLGDLEEEDPDLTNLRGARALVLNGEDDDNAAMALSARFHGFQGKIIARVENPSRRPPMRRAGASVVFTPEHVLAGVIAAGASAKLGPRVAGLRQLGGHLEVGELRVGSGSPLVGKTIAAAGIRAATGASVVGIWVGGEVVPHPAASHMLDAGMILIAVGSQEAIDRLSVLATPIRRPGPFVVLGYDGLGKKVVEFLREADEEVVVLHPEATSGADLVGDPLSLDLLAQARVADAQAVILTLDSDSATLFAAAVVRSVAPDEVIIAGVSRAENVARIHRAGADFAPSLSQVAGQFLAFHILGQRSVLLEAEIRIEATAAGSLAGRRLDWSAIKERTECVVVAVERGTDVLVEFGGDFLVQDGDVVHVSGTSEMLADYHRRFPGTVLKAQGAPAAS